MSGVTFAIASIANVRGSSKNMVKTQFHICEFDFKSKEVTESIKIVFF